MTNTHAQDMARHPSKKVAELNMPSSPKIAIVGAGIAGLYTAYLLQQKGYTAVVFEASPRVGGRIHTHYFPQPHEGTGDYTNAFSELGSMRVPCSAKHDSFFELVDLLNIELIPYHLHSPGNLAYVNGQVFRETDNDNWAAACPILPEDLPANLRDRSPNDLLRSVLGRFLAHLPHATVDTIPPEIKQYDHHSFRSYLNDVEEWPIQLIEWVELATSQSGQFNLAFTELVMQYGDFDQEEWVTIAGGMSRLPERLAQCVGWTNIRLEARVDLVVQRDDDAVLLGAVGPDGTRHEPEVFDKVVFALPPAALQGIPTRPRWGFPKEQALRSVNYQPLYKMALLFRSRFWERGLVGPDGEEVKSLGGQSTTDLRFRWIVYPSNGLGADGPAALMLYCWQNDAIHMAGMPAAERLNTCLHDLDEFFNATRATFGTPEMPQLDLGAQLLDWVDMAWAHEFPTGDAAFAPGQFSTFFDDLRRPEGGVAGNHVFYFAGEHLSTHHTWIAGALESALDTVSSMPGTKSSPFLRSRL